MCFSVFFSDERLSLTTLSGVAPLGFSRPYRDVGDRFFITLPVASLQWHLSQSKCLSFTCWTVVGFPHSLRMAIAHLSWSLLCAQCLFTQC